MEEKSHIRFNPKTKEIEIEGSEAFVKAYFNKLQRMVSGLSRGIAEESEVETVCLVKKAMKKPKVAKASPDKKLKKAARKTPGEKRVTNIGALVALIQASPEGISTAELKKKTGLGERQIWTIVNRAKKEGKIRKVKRGLYGGIAGS